MSEHLPYEDELSKRLSDLPLPDEDMAWEDMKRRMEKEDDDGPIVPPLLKGCGGYALLLLILVIAGLFIIDPLKWFHDKDKKENIHTVTKNNDSGIGHTNAGNKVIPPGSSNSKTASDEDTILTGKAIASFKPRGDTSFKINASSKNGPVPDSKNKLAKNASLLKQIKRKNYSFRQQNNNLIANNNHPRKPLKKIGGKLSTIVSGYVQDDSLTTASKNVNPIDEIITGQVNDTTIVVVKKKEAALDSIQKKKVDTTAADAKVKPGSSNPKRIYFSAGIAIHQLLPIAGQKSTPYNSLGRKSSLGDYIPSIYLRMYKDKRWFIQSEFRYGAPQYTKEIAFIQKKVIDSFTSSTTVSSSNVKKTFYHQLPVSFNYFVLPGLSMGAGFTFNKFKSAVVQADVYKINAAGSIDSLVSTALTSQKKADSNFVTTYFQALVEMQYQWKRFSLGARYSFGLQPYLKFQLPGGEQRTERNTSLQLFIRYELWKSK
ncbi:MAG: hypothetical protein ABIQ31_24970 [Ferruginibacter sp.]